MVCLVARSHRVALFAKLFGCHVWQLLGLDPILLDSAEGLMTEVTLGRHQNSMRAHFDCPLGLTAASAHAPLLVRLYGKCSPPRPHNFASLVGAIDTSGQVTTIAEKYADRCDRSKALFSGSNHTCHSSRHSPTAP